MSDDHPKRGSKPKSFFQRFSALFDSEPETQEQLLEILHGARERGLIDDDALSMIEGALQVASLKARDLMVPRAQMDVVDIAQSPEEFIPFVMETNHSRFPVVEEGRDHVIGILLAKDLLHYYTEKDFDVRDNLRPAVFIPESKPLNVLLREFRESRNHMAIVVDEYGGVSGLITIEDVLEQIVGDIEDEHDYDEDEDNIIADRGGRFRVRALTEIEQFNEFFNVALSDEDADTIGGLVTSTLSRMPRRGDKIVLDSFEFEVLRADARQVHVLMVRPLTKEELELLQAKEDKEDN
ncbi:HlyC/CorC family transporter [Hydromonas duriensis]|uniref:Magnesium and cobalt efflux protein CorC n=1 Tax=Hydromonas duriensis TaxID=1527608 RepID=A0A4R6YB16_9BURK|nr:transporter associated domain-containing protein [Hydromonas duriensis]TDR32779.1 Mg2+/Co2+ transporter CorC [Hydromonas duriensis]